MNIDFLSLTVFAVVTTFTPGPNNISSALFGMNYGCRKTIKFLLGIASGFFLILLLSAIFSNIFSYLLNEYQNYLKIIGSIYIFFLAISIFRKTDEKQNIKLNTYWNGFLLQFVNPKGIIYGLVLFTSFLTPISNNIKYLILFSLIFAMLSFVSINLWAYLGETLSSKITNRKILNSINYIMLVGLLYVAIDMLLEVF